MAFVMLKLVAKTTTKKKHKPALPRESLARKTVPSFALIRGKTFTVFAGGVPIALLNCLLVFEMEGFVVPPLDAVLFSITRYQRYLCRGSARSGLGDISRILLR